MKTALPLLLLTCLVAAVQSTGSQGCPTYVSEKCTARLQECSNNQQQEPLQNCTAVHADCVVQATEDCQREQSQLNHDHLNNHTTTQQP
ncbi:enticin precursor [Aplysia californica]|uniref:Enticin n=1 Tax=Aplysia californica TaxID=6500 RepID=ENTIC_APLCA|nr:enticin precursor [Aplysia californica]Q8I817.1 RecName: Full=Enticin; Flags: Precursor [Aplysia californica]AAN83923.1 enticin [Aplysia californica]